jgi:glyoxylase-like metal-dependent hydrolase (beta-lactamase superfamily II)
MHLARLTPLAVSLVLTAGGPVRAPMGPAPAPPSRALPVAADSVYEVYAVRYATIPGFPVRGLVAGADSSRTMGLAMTVWVARNADRVVLVDAGFYRDKFMARWKPEGFVRPSDALAPLGIRPEDVTDLVITHVHWDHLDGADLFPNARVWIQKDEIDHYVGTDGTALERAIDALDATMLAALDAQGRVARIDGDARDFLPGITAYTGGKHTFASQFLGVRTAEGTVVIASDNCYLYENLDRHVAIAQTLDAGSNLAAQERMRSLAAAERFIVPGHDPAVFDRFPEPGGGVARIAGGVR